MSAKNLDRHNRWRNKTIAFRMSPQEADVLDSNVRISGGKYPQQTLLQKAQSLGISKRVLDEAKKTLRVRSVKKGSVWYWQLPEEKESSDL